MGAYHQPTDESTPNTAGATAIAPAYPYTLNDVNNSISGSNPNPQITPGLRKDVIFPNAFSTIPVVMAVAQNETGSAYPDGFSVTITDVSPTGFQILVHRTDRRTDGWGQDLEVAWFAFQY